MKTAKHVLALLMVAACPAFAGESPFGWIYIEDAHPRDQLAFEKSVVVQGTRTQDDYSNTLLQTDLAYGVTDSYQVTLHLSSRYINVYRSNIEGFTGGPDVDPGNGFGLAMPNSQWRFESVSLESMYQAQSINADPVGLAFYVEPVLGASTSELHWKLLLQKNFIDDRIIWATNLETAMTRATLPGSVVARATELNLQTGVSWSVTNHWALGLELRNHREFSGYGFREPGHSAWFLGPSVKYAAGSWWVTAGWRNQLPCASAFTEDQREAMRDGRIYGDEHTRNEVVVRFGIPLAAKQRDQFFT
jgi:hypothetical protein